MRPYNSEVSNNQIKWILWIRPTDASSENDSKKVRNNTHSMNISKRLNTHRGISLNAWAASSNLVLSFIELVSERGIGDTDGDGLYFFTQRRIKL